MAGTMVIMDGITLGPSEEVSDLDTTLFIGTKDSMVVDLVITEVFMVDSTILFTETLDSTETEALALETIVIMQVTEDSIILIEETT